MNNRVKISPLQLSIILINTMFGATLLTLPHSLAQIVREDLWISVLLGSSLILISYWTAAKLGECFPDLTAVEYHPVLIGRVPGMILNIFMLLLMIMYASLFIRIVTTSIKAFLLDLTPPQVISYILLIAGFYATQDGFVPTIRLQQLLFLPSHSLFISIILLGLLSINSNHFQPMLAEGLAPVLQGVIPTYSSYSGPELALGFLYPFITKKKHAFKFGAYSIGIVTLLYVLISGITLGILGADETAFNLIPTVMAYRYVEIPDTFIERLDGYLMTIWIVIVFMALVSWSSCISFGIGQIVKTENSRPLVVFLLPAIHYLVMLPPDQQTVNSFTQWINLAGIFWGLCILPLLLLIARFKEKRKKRCST